MVAAPSIHDHFQRDLARAERNMALSGVSGARNRSKFLECLQGSTEYLQMLRHGDIRDAAPPIAIWPVKEAYRLRKRDPEEAIWLAFLATHIGWDRPDSCEQLYCALGCEPLWQWSRVRSEGGTFVHWLTENHTTLSQVAPFGSHRKFETHKPGRGTRDTIGTHLRLVGKSQVEFLKSRATRDDPFDHLYSAFAPVPRFGRLARYDFVRLLANLGILKGLGLGVVQPQRCYLAGATGPLKGAKRMFGAGDPPKRGKSAWLDGLERQCARLAVFLECDLQVIEDALCNWQKEDQSQSSCRPPARDRAPAWR